MKRRVTIEAFGRVQGVFLRRSVSAFCSERAITGSVGNTPRGSVRIEADGEERALQELLAWLEGSPGDATIDRVSVTWENGRGPWSDFSILS